MKTLLWLLMLFALAVGVSLAAHYNDGYLLLVLPPYRVELTLNLALALLVGAFVVVHALLRIFAAMLDLPRRVRAYRQRLRNEKAGAAFNDVVRLLFEGRYGQALSKATAVYDAGLSPALAALYAAYAALCLRQPDKQKAWLQRALVADARMQGAVSMLEARMHLQTGDFDAALQSLLRLQSAAGRHIAALRLELRAEQGRGNRDAVRRLARLLETHGALSAQDAAALRGEAGVTPQP